jgi:hypothetical protein
MRWLRWERPEQQPLRHPYRDAAIFYGILAGLIVLVTALTHGNLLPGEVENKGGILRLIAEFGAIPVAAVFFVVATGFSWWRWRVKEQQARRPRRP